MARSMLQWFVQYKRFGRFKRVFDRKLPATRPPLARVIHMYWQQGFDAAPDIVSISVESWRTMNPGWEVRLWTGNPLADVSAQPLDLPQGTTIQTYSDFLRMALLRRYGGVWADATTICRVPLDHWLPLAMSHADFFAFSLPGGDRPIANWFLAARPDSVVLDALWHACLRFWQGRATPTRVYHWQQYTFDWLLRTSSAFRAAWTETPKLSAVPSFPTWQGEAVATVLKRTHKTPRQSA